MKLEWLERGSGEAGAMPRRPVGHRFITWRVSPKQPELLDIALSTHGRADHPIIRRSPAPSAHRGSRHAPDLPSPGSRRWQSRRSTPVPTYFSSGDGSSGQPAPARHDGCVPAYVDLRRSRVPVIAAAASGDDRGFPVMMMLGAYSICSGRFASTPSRPKTARTRPNRTHLQRPKWQHRPEALSSTCHDDV